MKPKHILPILLLFVVAALGECPGPDNEVRNFMFEDSNGVVDVPNPANRTSQDGYVKWLEENLAAIGVAHCNLWAKVDTLTRAVQTLHGTAPGTPPPPTVGTCPDPYPSAPPPWPPQ
jgi:hypothetical protein